MLATLLFSATHDEMGQANGTSISYKCTLIVNILSKMNIIFISHRMCTAAFLMYCMLYTVDPDDVFVLRSTWKEMSQRSGGKGIDKQTFQSYFQLCKTNS